ncbi:MAG: TetR/AcrR family transcriptional regulator [Corynebacteriales bacterium]|nr:TetR/AcrR family transcriptional regulator [Mycobacteriales bacterium]
MSTVADQSKPETTSTRGPGRPRAARTEAAIHEAVLNLLADHGISGVSMEGVANEAGVAKTTIYRRWSDKRSLILDALKAMKAPLPQPPGNNVREDLLILMKRMRDEHNDSRAMRIFPKIFSEVDSDPELIRAFRREVMEPRRQPWRDILRRGIDEGTVDPDIDVWVAIEMLVSPIITCKVTREERYTDEELCRVLDIVLTGIAPQTAR